MSKSERMDLIHDGPEKEINIFIHGFLGAVISSEYDKLVSQILAAKPKGKVYLFYWDSGRINSKLALQGIGASRGLALIPNPYAKAVTALIALFESKKRRAEKLGNNLKSRISKIKNAKDLPINLIGHSLGGRMIHYALSSNDWSDYKIKDCVLLGAATNSNDKDWDDCAKEISGKIYNVYSKGDWIVSLSGPGVPKAGKYGIGGYSTSKIINHQFKKIGHLNYWENLQYILERSWKNYSPSKHIHNDTECPYCKMEFDFQGDGEYFCNDCGLDFSMENGEAYYLKQKVYCTKKDCEGHYEININNPPEPGEYFDCPECGTTENYIVKVA